MKILFIDDDVCFLQIIEHFARELKGFDILLCSRVEEGIRLWREGKPDVVVIDNCLMEMEAQDVISLVGDHKTKIYILSAIFGKTFSANRRVAEALKDFNIIKLLNKPFLKKDLIELTMEIKNDSID